LISGCRAPVARTSLRDQVPVACFPVPGCSAGLHEIPEREVPDSRRHADAFSLLPVDVAVKLIEFAALTFGYPLDGIGDSLTVVRLSRIRMLKLGSSFFPPLATMNFVFCLAIRTLAVSLNLFRFPPVGQPDNVIRTEVLEVVYQGLKAGLHALPH